MRIIKICEGPTLNHGPMVIVPGGDPQWKQPRYIGTGLWCIDSDGLLYAQVLLNSLDGGVLEPLWFPVRSKVVNE